MNEPSLVHLGLSNILRHKASNHHHRFLHSFLFHALWSLFAAKHQWRFIKESTAHNGGCSFFYATPIPAGWQAGIVCNRASLSNIAKVYGCSEAELKYFASGTGCGMMSWPSGTLARVSQTPCGQPRVRQAAEKGVETNCHITCCCNVAVSFMLSMSHTIWHFTP